MTEVREREGRARDGLGKEMDFRKERRRKQKPLHSTSSTLHHSDKKGEMPWLGSPEDALDSPLAFYSSILDDFASILMLVSSWNQGDKKNNV